MANLQALGADNNTIIYLSATGHGTEISPFKSIFAAEQHGAWTVTLLNNSLAVTGNFFPEIQAVSQSGNWTITVDNQLTGYATAAKQDNIISSLDTINTTLNGILDVDTGFTQPITDSQLRAAPVNVNQSSLPGLRIPDHDDIELLYTGDQLTQVLYKASGVVVATIDLTYAGDNLIRVARS